MALSWLQFLFASYLFVIVNTEELLFHRLDESDSADLKRVVNAISDPVVVYIGRISTDKILDQIKDNHRSKKNPLRMNDDLPSALLEKRPDGENQAYHLLHLLRSGDPDNLNEGIEKTKSALRQALIARCQTYSTCVQQCPPRPKKQYECKTICKEKLDDLNLCAPPPQEDRCPSKYQCEKRGKTMPPYWLRLLKKK